MFRVITTRCNNHCRAVLLTRKVLRLAQFLKKVANKLLLKQVVLHRGYLDLERKRRNHRLPPQQVLVRVNLGLIHRVAVLTTRSQLVVQPRQDVTILAPTRKGIYRNLNTALQMR